MFASADGNTWAEVGTGFPTYVGRIGLAVQPGNPGVVYAFAAGRDDHHWLYLLDVADGVWREVTGAPADLFGVDPMNGDRAGTTSRWPSTPPTSSGCSSADHSRGPAVTGQLRSIEAT